MTASAGASSPRGWPSFVQGSQAAQSWRGATRRRPRNRPGQDQARLADHPREQVLRRELHRTEQQHLPVADAARAGRAAEELLRDGPLQPRQLHLDGQRPGDPARHPGRLPVLHQFTGILDTTGTLQTNPNYGQMDSAAGPERGGGLERLRVPGERPDAVRPVRRRARELEGLRPGSRQPRRRAGLASPAPQHDAGCSTAALRTRAPGPTGSTAQPNPGWANATDQYVPKHFPFPWFESILASGDCNRQHIANLFDPTNGLYHDLQSEATTPEFSWISPNNCSDGHDAVCHGNNLSGGFSDPNTPNPPKNYTGGLYAADLFLEQVIPEIEASPAFKDGGLIDITFDEAFPPFTYTGNSFTNSKLVPRPRPPRSRRTRRPRRCTVTASTGSRRAQHAARQDASGNQLYPGPGDNAYIDRPTNCVAQTVPRPAGGHVHPRRRQPPARRAHRRRRERAGRQLDDQGRRDRGNRRGPLRDGHGIPAGAFVGKVTDTSTTRDVAKTGARRHGLVHARRRLGHRARDDRPGERHHARRARRRRPTRSTTPPTRPPAAATRAAC